MALGEGSCVLLIDLTNCWRNVSGGEGKFPRDLTKRAICCLAQGPALAAVVEAEVAVAS